MPESHLASAFLVSPHDRRYQLLLKRLREARTQAGLSQVEVAKRLGLVQPLNLSHRVRERKLDPIEFGSCVGCTSAVLATSSRTSDLGSPLGPRPEVCLLALSFPPLPNHATSVINSNRIVDAIGR